MYRRVDQQRKLRQTLWSAKISAFLFGLALLAWGLGPAVVHRIATGELPPTSMLAVSSLSLIMGLLLIALAVLIGRGPAWPLRGTLVLALAVLLGSVSLLLLGNGTGASLFPLLLALATAATSWLALDARRPTQQPQRRAHPS